MLFGGLFLYISYYGTDQTQVQRVLAAPSVALARKSLFINGLLRFPLVLSYCVLGIVLAAFVAHNPQLMHEAKKIDELFPRFIVTYFPKGVVGLIIAGMMAATMSSLDAAFTSLSAATMRDFIERFNWIRSANTKKYMLSARITTFSWGIVCCAFGLMLKGGDTVIVLINKIGSLFYGPMLGVFIVAFLSRWINSLGVIIGLICGISLNVILWFGFHSISWWWWNLFSFVFTVGIACVFSLPDLYRKKFADIGMDKKEVTDSDKYDTMRYVILGLAALAIVLISWGLGQVCMLKG
jgi:SSS family solute:Na+ symporter